MANSPWTNAYILVISEARMFARAWDDANHFGGFNPFSYVRTRQRLAIQRMRLECALAQYRAELVKAG